MPTLADRFYTKSGGAMSKKKDRRDKPTKKKSDTTVIVAVIGAIVTIVVALLGFPPLIAYLTPSPAATPVPSFSSSSTNTSQPDTLTPSLTFTETDTPTFAPTETFTPTATFTFVPLTSTFTPTSGLPIGMQIKITANTTNGRAPLNVTLNARDSFVRALDGTIFECRKGGCSYTWYVYVNGQQFIDPQKTNGTLELKLGKRGNYFVSVYICHGADNPTCASGGTVVIVE